MRLGARIDRAPPPEPSVPPCTIVRQRSRVVVIVFQFETRRAETSARITGRTPRGALRGDAILCMLGTRARRGGTTTRVAFKHDESTTRRASRVGEPLAGMEGSPAGVVRNAPRMKPRSPVVAPSASRPPRVARARVVGRANLAGRDGGSVRGSSDAAPLGVDDDALATAEAEAERLKERFAFATDAREREEALRSATEAQLRVNVMHAERAFTPEAERRAAASATRALAGARRLLAELAESRDVPVPSPSAATRASPARLRASPSPSRARARAPGETAASFPGTDSVPVPSASPVLPARSPTSRASPETSASPNVPAASPARRSSPGKPRVESPAPARRSASRALFPAFDTDERHAAAVRLQRIQRGRAARARVKAMSEARRSAARGIPVDPHAPLPDPGSPRTRESGGGISGGSRRSSRVGATRDAPRASDGGTRREGGDLRDGGRRRGRREPSGSVRA